MADLLCLLALVLAITDTEALRYCSYNDYDVFGISHVVYYTCLSSQSCCGSRCCSTRHTVFSAWYLWVSVVLGLVLLAILLGAYVRSRNRQRGRVMQARVLPPGGVSVHHTTTFMRGNRSCVRSTHHGGQTFMVSSQQSTYPSTYPGYMMPPPPPSCPPPPYPSYPQPGAQPFQQGALQASQLGAPSSTSGSDVMGAAQPMPPAYTYNTLSSDPNNYSKY